MQEQQHKLILSPTSVVGVMKSITKSAYMISTDAKKFMYDCAVKFVEVIFAEAKEIRRQQGDNIFTGDHIVEALGNIGLSEQYGYFSAFIQLYRYSEEDHHRAMVNGSAQIDQPQLIGTALMEQQGNNPGYLYPYLVDHLRAMVNANAQIDQPQPIGAALMEQQGNNPGHPDPYLVYPGVHMALPLQVPSHAPIPPIGTQIMQGAHVPLVDLGIPVISHSYVHHSQLVLSLNNHGQLLLPEQAQPVPPQMLLPNAIGIGAHHFEQQEEEEVPDPIMYEGDDGDSTSGISEV